MLPPAVAPEAFKSPLTIAPLLLLREISPPLLEVELEFRLEVVRSPLVAVRAIAPPVVVTLPKSEIAPALLKRTSPPDVDIEEFAII